MTIQNSQLLEETDHYTYHLTADKSAVLSRWKPVAGLSIEDFQNGIAGLAAQCATHRPARAAINAAALDQNSPAYAWLRGQNPDTGREKYDDWWTRVILPVFHDAGINSLAVGTGDPNAPGELPQIPPGVKFKIGYFPDITAALEWHVDA